jgi:hypothetical protein
LGEDHESVRGDGHAWTANHSRSFMVGTTVHSLALANGVTVREYVDASGTVFAVGWDGPVLPDFVRLLGIYFPSYQEALGQKRRGVSVNRSDLVLEAGGAMRGFYGRAWLPERLPKGLNIQEIR